MHRIVFLFFHAEVFVCVSAEADSVLENSLRCVQTLNLQTALRI